jgi:ubiquinone/menaquinone biosynthesis C-methylase UbiE
MSSAKVGLSLYDALTRPDFANSFTVNKTAFNIAQNTDKGMFEHLLSNHDPKKLELFVQGMKKIGTIAAESVPRSYPWDALRHDATVVDVGGGTGLIMMAVIKSFPHLKLVVQDVESAIDEGRKVLMKSQG